MHPNEELLTKFYTSFQQKDAAGMAACYRPDVSFSDPVFQDLKGERAVAMWRMLTERSPDLKITFDAIRADDRQGSAHWEAIYTYSATGRKVLNIIDAHFRFQDGKILTHQDTFDLWKWAAQALGLSGRLFGWTPFLQKVIRQKADHLLTTYMTKSTGEKSAPH